MLLQLSKTVKQSPKSPQIFENNGAFCADRPFSKNRSETNCQKSFVFNQLVSELQSYILSTTTETWPRRWRTKTRIRFNRTSFQQQLKHWVRNVQEARKASIVHPFNNNLNIRSGVSAVKTASFNRTSFQQQLKLCLNICALCSLRCFNRTSFQQQLKHSTLGPSLPPS